MKISQIMLSKGFGGGERYFVDLAIALAEMGYRVQAVIHEKFNTAHLLEPVDGIEIATTSSRGMWDRLALRRLVNDIAAFDPDVMHSHMARAAWAGSKTTQRISAPLISTTHNYVDLKYYTGVSRFIPTTKDQERYLIEQGIAAERVRRIPNFSMFEPAAGTVERGDAPIRYIAFGRFVEKKGYAVLIDAFAKARSAGLDESSTLRIGGGGPLEQRLKDQVRQLGLTDVITFDGWIDDVEAYLRKGDVFVLPSLDEPFGIVMIEAMASGRPIVTTRTQGPSEVLDASCAQFADIGDSETLSQALLAIQSDWPAAIAGAREALHRYRRLYSREAVVPQILSLYEESLAVPAAASGSLGS